MLLVDDKGEQANFTEAVKTFLKAWQPSNGITAHALVGNDHVMVVKGARVIASLLVAPEPVRGYLWLLVWLLGLVKECVMLSEAEHTE